MSTIGQGEYRSKIAAADLSGYQYRFVTLSSNQVNIADSTADKAYGILQNRPESGEVASVKVEGESKLDCTSTSGLSVDQYVAPAATGKGMAAPSTSYPRGVVVGPTTDATSLCVVELFYSGAALA